MKRLISFFALIAVWATMALAHDFEVDGIYYIKNSDGTSVSVCYKGSFYDEYSGEYSGSVTIPPTVTYSGITFPVTSIGGRAFKDCSGLTSVTIPNSVKTIFNYAFENCSGLTSVTIGNSVASIGESAFYNCSGLTSVTIPDSVTEIGESAFCYCSGLTSVTIGNSVTSIGRHAFQYCSGLTSVTIPDSVTSIGWWAFQGCSGLTSVTIGNSVTSIGYLAFSDCSGLTSVTIGNSVTEIGQFAFQNCSGLTKVEISDLAAWCRISFGDNPLFYAHHLYLNGSEIKDLVIPNSVTEIGESAFCYCSGLTSVTIGKSVTSIGGSAFYGCSGLTSVNWNAKNCSDFERADKAPFKGLTGIKTFTFGTEVERIPAYLCSGLSGLTSVTIGNSVTSIGGAAFLVCSGLTSVTIPNSVTSIGTSAFIGCNNIESLTWNAKNCASMGEMPKSMISTLSIGDGVETLPAEFVKGSKITSVTIPNSVTSIGPNAFYGCSGLTNLIWNAKNCSSNGNMPTGGITSATIGNEVEILPENFLNGSKITSITIPNSVTSIGGSAFYGCSGLTSVTIPNSVTSIGNSAFYGCSSLTSVTIPNSVTEIGGSAFSGTAWFNNQPDGLVYINNVAYKYKGSISTGTSITIKEGTVSISPYCFCDYYNLPRGLISVTIPNSVTSIGDRAFEYCIGLTSVTIGNSVTSIGDYAFGGCRGLTSVTNYASTPQTISSNVFYDDNINNCKLYVWHESRDAYNAANVWKDFDIQQGLFINDGLRYVINSDGITVTVIGSEKGGSVIIPKSVEYLGITYPVTAIGNGAFKECSSLTSVTIPNSVTTIGNSAFHSCNGLTSVNWNAKTCNDFSGYSAPFKGLTGIKTFTFGNEVERIPAYLCDGLSGLTSIEIPNSVTSIGERAFSGCSGLTSVTIGNSVASIGESAFYNCSGLSSVTIPDSVTSIGERAFSGCSGLTSLIWNAKNCSSMGDMPKSNISTVTIGNEVEILPDNFLNGSKITEITIPSSVTTIGNSAFERCSGLTSVTIPNSVTAIGGYAFHGCSGLTSVNIPNSVTSIGKCAFGGCSGLTSVTIPNSVTSIGVGAFSGCNGLTSVTIPNSVASIGYAAFSGCNGLTSVTIPNSVTSIGYAAFSGCSGLTSVTIPNSVTSIGGAAFSGCSGLTSVTIGNSVTSIGTATFSGCSGLTSVDIPNSVSEIGGAAFEGCSGLTSVTIPNSVASIGSYAFCDCSGLTRIDSYPNPDNVLLGYDVFHGVPKDKCTLHVGTELYEAYSTAEQWKEFFNIVADINGVEGVEVDAATKEVEGYYNLQGIRLNEPARGQAVIVRYTDGTAKKVVVK